MRLQEFRVTGNMVGCEGPYRVFYTGEEDKKEHGVGIFLMESTTSGEFEVQQLQYVNTRCMMWIVEDL